jgi:hypothetical protein
MKEAYIPSLYWISLSAGHYKKLRESGYDNFKRTVALQYHTDFRDGDDINKYKNTIKSMWDIAYEELPAEFLDKLHEPVIGNPIHIEYRGRVVTLDFAGVKKVSEIGAGYGRTAWVFLLLHDLKYTIFDIKPAIEISERYLRAVLPERNITFKDPCELGGKCDLMIAIDCLHEMTRKQVEDYFEYIDKNARYFYFSCFKQAFVPFDGINWGIDDYPCRKNWKIIFTKQHSMRPDYFEVLVDTNG